MTLTKIFIYSLFLSQEVLAFSCPQTVAEANAMSAMEYSLVPLRCASQGQFNIPQRTVVSAPSQWTTIKLTSDGKVFQAVKVPNMEELHERESKLLTLTESTILCHPQGSAVGPICQPGQAQVGTRTYKPSPYTQEEVDSMSPLEHSSAVMRSIQQGYSIQPQQIIYKTVKKDEVPAGPSSLETPTVVPSVAPAAAPSVAVTPAQGNGLGGLPQGWNENEYLRCNSDVAVAVKNADVGTQRAAQAAQVTVAGLHYLMFGKKEGRSPAGGCASSVSGIR